MGFDLLIKIYELVSEYSPAERLQLCSYHFQIVELKTILFQGLVTYISATNVRISF